MKKSVKLFFSTDLHGSTLCFKKFLSAKKFYSADYTILGGDLSGKKLIFIKKFLNEYTVKLDNGLTEKISKLDISNFCNNLEDAGIYYQIIEPDQPVDVKDFYMKKVKERLLKWLELAFDEKGKIYLIPGNDDELYVDGIINSQPDIFVICDRKIVETENFNILGYSYVTPTPWNTAREKTDYDIGCDLKNIQLVDNKKPLILNIHVPPKGIGLDTVAELDSDLKPIYTYGGIKTVLAGSESVRDYVCKVKPILGLFGHIHECRYITSLGKTLCVNPGSTYNEGKLQGFIGVLNGDKVDSWQLTEG